MRVRGVCCNGCKGFTRDIIYVFVTNGACSWFIRTHVHEMVKCYSSSLPRWQLLFTPQRSKHKQLLFHLYPHSFHCIIIVLLDYQFECVKFWYRCFTQLGNDIRKRQISSSKPCKVASHSSLLFDCFVEGSFERKGWRNNLLSPAKSKNFVMWMTVSRLHSNRFMGWGTGEVFRLYCRRVLLHFKPNALGLENGYVVQVIWFDGATEIWISPPSKNYS